MRANYHTHTLRCHHAFGEDREYVESAIEQGFQILGFSDHCPWVYPDDFVSTIRMRPAEVDGYFASLERLKAEYQNDIKIYVGYEAEYCASLLEGQDRLLQDYPLDYMILGQHFLGVERDMCYCGTLTRDESVLCSYVDLVLEGLETGRYLYLAHPDLIHYAGEDSVYHYHMERLCQFLKEKEIPAEMNILGLADGRHYPNTRFWEIASEVGCSAILGVDAHMPSQLRNHEAIRQAERLCEQYGISVLDGDIIP